MGEVWPEPDNDDGETGSCRCGNPIYDDDIICTSCADDWEVQSSRGW